MVSCSSSALRWLSRPSPGTWLGEKVLLRAGMSAEQLHAPTHPANDLSGVLFRTHSVCVSCSPSSGGWRRTLSPMQSHCSKMTQAFPCNEATTSTVYQES